MTLREYLVKRHWAIDTESKKCLCPFHGDRNPSAMINDNNIYCFVCLRTYTLYDFRNAFGVELDRVEEGSSTLDLLHGGLSAPPEDNKPYFYYPWVK